MKQLKSTGDIRTLGSCAFCGGSTGTRDHCPSRVFLDEPYPNNLPVVHACSECNAGFSADEEYLACLVSCVIAGTTDPDQIDRKKIKRILLKKPALRSRIDLSISESDGQTTYQPESDRVSTVVTKLAKGHALFELHELCIEPPTTIEILPLMLLHGERLDMFENPGKAFAGWPEVGSRMMDRLITGADLDPSGWINVQPGRYRFHALADGALEIRIVIGEYLACHVSWEN